MVRPAGVVRAGTGCYAFDGSSDDTHHAPRRDRLPPGGGSWIAMCRRPTGNTEPCLVSRYRTGTGRSSIDITVTSLRFSVIGAGRLGASLALAFQAQGLSLAGFTSDSPAGRTKAEGWLGGHALSRLSDIVALDPDVYVLSVPDQAVPEVAAELGALLATRGQRRDPRPPVVLHTSGATPVAALRSCERAGAIVLAFHPLQTFTDPLTGQHRFFGTAVAVTPSPPQQDSPAAAFGFSLAGALGARPFILDDDKRGLYHAAATIACNYLVTLEHHAERLFVEAGLDEREALALFLPLVTATLDNLREQGSVAALTGPLSRGDTRTIAGHLRALVNDAPHLLPLYRVLGLATLELVRARADIDPAVIGDMTSILTAFAPPPEEEPTE